MKDKKYTDVKADSDEMERFNTVANLSYNDAKALLAQIDEVPTVDEIPLEPLKENVEVDSNAYKLNEVPGSIQLDRNGPK